MGPRWSYAPETEQLVQLLLACGQSGATAPTAAGQAWGAPGLGAGHGEVWGKLSTRQCASIV